MQKIRNHIMSGCSRLRFISVDDIERFAVVRDRVHMLVMGKISEAHETPGTVKPSTTANGDGYSVSITYTFSKFDSSAVLVTQAWRSRRIVAVFNDEVGRLRVAGSPSYPLKLTAEESEGVIHVTLSGDTDSLNPFLPVGESFF